MNKLFISLIALTLTFTLQAQDAQSDSFKKVVNAEQFEALVNKTDDVLYVVNFWATWCGPCVEELPDFMAVNKKFASNKNFKMLLISLDNARVLNDEVRPFLKKHKITADVYLLDDIKRMNYWMPRVDKSWSGSIPATVFYKNGKKLQFVEKQLHEKELTTIINQYIQL